MIHILKLFHFQKIYLFSQNLQASLIEGMTNINGFMNHSWEVIMKLQRIHLLLVILLSVKYVVSIYR